MKIQINRAGALVAAAAALAFPALAQGEYSSDRGGDNAQRGDNPQRGGDKAQRGEDNSRRGGENGRRGGDRTKPDKPVSWIVKGEVTATGEDTVTVMVKRSNRHGRALRDREVTFDVSNARIVVRDVNEDGVRDLADVSVGDRAKLQARRPKRSTLAEGEAMPAKRGIFRAPEPEEADEQAEEADEQAEEADEQAPEQD